MERNWTNSGQLVYINLSIVFRVFSAKNSFVNIMTWVKSGKKFTLDKSKKIISVIRGFVSRQALKKIRKKKV